MGVKKHTCYRLGHALRSLRRGSFIGGSPAIAHEPLKTDMLLAAESVSWNYSWIVEPRLKLNVDELSLAYELGNRYLTHLTSPNLEQPHHMRVSHPKSAARLEPVAPEP